MNDLYPLKFKPIFKEKIWGGDKIKTVFGMDYSPLPNCGEAWVLSGHGEEISEVTNGFLAENQLDELIEIYMGDLVGEAVYEKYGNKFPLLIKILNSSDWLSIQVHPDDKLAESRHNDLGKTEMWYIADAEPGAELISGFNREMTPELYLSNLNNGTLKEIMNYEKVEKGDVYFIPAGRVHALGPGLLLFEIQQTSDLTYRIYDFDRVDDKGNPRQLHTEQALDALDFMQHPGLIKPFPWSKAPISTPALFILACLLLRITAESIHLSSCSVPKESVPLNTMAVPKACKPVR
jgi:mannose-6-phosphate isomerase